MIIAVIALPLMTDAQTRRSGRSSSISVDGLVRDCGDIRVTYARRPAITEQTEMTLSPSQVSTLRAQVDNSGIYLNGWDRNEYSVKTCKAVPDDDPNPTVTLRAITTSNANGQLSVQGPNNSTYYKTRADKLYLAVAEEAPFQIRILEPKVPLVQAGTIDLKVIIA